MPIRYLPEYPYVCFLIHHTTYTKRSNEKNTPLYRIADCRNHDLRSFLRRFLAATVRFRWHQRADATGFSIGTKGYIGTGYTGTYSTDWWEWDQATDTWTQKANYPGPGIVEAVAFSIGGKGYVLPAPTGNDFWCFDPVANSWSAKATFPGDARQAAVAFAIDIMGYITTGTSGNPTTMNDLWEYNSVTDSWSQKTAFPGTMRHYACGFSIGSKGYLAPDSPAAGQHC